MRETRKQKMERRRIHAVAPTFEPLGKALQARLDEIDRRYIERRYFPERQADEGKASA